MSDTKQTTDQTTTDQTTDELMDGPTSPQTDVSSQSGVKEPKRPRNKDAPPFADIPPFHE